MKYFLPVYLQVAHKRRKKYDLAVDEFCVEGWDLINSDAREQYYIAGYGKKRKLIFAGYFNACSMEEISDKIKKSNLVIVKSKRFCRNNALNMLREYSYREGCFAPVVYSGGEEVLFFPQLRYEDGLLVKWLLKQQFKEEMYYVTYGSSSQLIAI